jgi:hypothetical protein
MEPGLEVVYHRTIPSDERIADDLSKVVSDYLKEHKIAAEIRIRKQTPDQMASPFQFDIHIGPDIAVSLAEISKPVSTPNESPIRRNR